MEEQPENYLIPDAGSTLSRGLRASRAHLLRESRDFHLFDAGPKAK